MNLLWVQPDIGYMKLDIQSYGNVDNKSDILAPFNSSMTDEGRDQYEAMKQEAEYYPKKEIMVFQKKAQVFDIAYERDFNDKIDHGVMLQNSIASD